MSINDMRDVKSDIGKHYSPDAFSEASEPMQKEANPSPSLRDLQQLQQSDRSSSAVRPANDGPSCKMPDASFDKDSITFTSRAGAFSGASEARDCGDLSRSAFKDGATRAINAGGLANDAAYEAASRAKGQKAAN